MKHYDDLILILVCFGIFLYIVFWIKYVLRESFGSIGKTGGGWSKMTVPTTVPTTGLSKVPITVPTTVPTTIPSTKSLGGGNLKFKSALKNIDMKLGLGVVDMISGDVARSSSSKQMQNINDTNLNFSNNETAINNKLNNSQSKINRVNNSIQNINQPNLIFFNNGSDIDNKLNNNTTNINTVKNSRENTKTLINNVSNTDLKVDNKQEISNAISSIETEQQAIDAEILDFENKIQTKYKKLFG